ncbi:MAG: HD domain-containing protein [Nitrososphaeraceae archaeon]
MFDNNNYPNSDRTIEINNEHSNHDIKDFNIDIFIQSIFMLKKIKRTGWLVKGKILDGESIADHSYSLSALCMIFSDIMGLDTHKVLKMCIIHDLAESIIGDIMPGEVPDKEKKFKENEAMKSILFSLPSSIKISYMKIWKEFLSNGSKEARLVHNLDKLEMMLQAKEYSVQGYPIKNLVQFLEFTKKSYDQEENYSLLNIPYIKNILKNLNNLINKT